MTRSPTLLPASLAGRTDAATTDRRHKGIDAWPVEGFDGRIAGVVTIADLRAVPVDERAATQVSAITTPTDALVQVPQTSTAIDLLYRPDGVAGRQDQCGQTSCRESVGQHW